MRTTLCKSCGRPIIFIKTPGGKSMPCDLRLVPYWEKAGASGKIVTPNGAVLSCLFAGERQAATGLGYIPHWASCQAANKFRNEPQKKEEGDMQQISLFDGKEA